MPPKNWYDHDNLDKWLKIIHFVPFVTQINYILSLLKKITLPYIAVKVLSLKKKFVPASSGLIFSYFHISSQ